MLANGGELDGARILAPSSVALMTTQSRAGGSEGRGQVRHRQLPACSPASASASTSRSTKSRRASARSVGKGTYLWDGIAGTWFWIDPTNDIVFVGMIQRWARPVAGPEHRGPVARPDDAGADRSVEVTDLERSEKRSARRVHVRTAARTARRTCAAVFVTMYGAADASRTARSASPRPSRRTRCPRTARTSSVPLSTPAERSKIDVGCRARR